MCIICRIYFSHIDTQYFSHHLLERLPYLLNCFGAFVKSQLTAQRSVSEPSNLVPSSIFYPSTILS